MSIRSEINDNAGKRIKKGLHNYRNLLKGALKAGDAVEVERLRRRIAERERLMRAIKK